jgi:hypothetical protein
MATDLGHTRAAPTAKYEAFVEQQLTRANRRVRVFDVLSACLGFLLISVSYFLVMLLCDLVAIGDRRLELNPLFRQVSFLVYVVAGFGYLAYFLVVPLTRRVNPYYAARRVEQLVPNAKNSVVNWLDLHGENLPAAIRGALGQRAAKDLSRADLERAISGRRAGWLGSLVAIGGVFLFLLLLKVGGTQFFSIFRRALAPFEDIGIATRTQLTLTKPEGGDVTVPVNRAVNFGVHVQGRVPDPGKPDSLRLLFRYQQANPYEELPLEKESGRDWSTIMPSLQVQNGFWYKIVGGDAETPEHRVTVHSTPMLLGFDVHYKYRQYTGWHDETGRDPNLKALRGTEVTVTAHTNRTVARGQADIEPSAANANKKSVPGELIGDDPQAIRFRFALEDEGKYRVSFTAQDGESNTDPMPYNIEVIPDHAPQVKLTKPETGAELPANAVLQIEGAASDDIGVQSFVLRMKVRDGVTLQAKPYRGGKDFRLKDGGYPKMLDYKEVVELAKLLDESKQPFPLAIGMQLEYWLEAADACDFPKPNVGESDHHFLTIVDPEKDQPKQKKQQEQAQKEKNEHDQKQDEDLKKENQERQDKGQQGDPQKNEKKDQGGQGNNQKDQKNDQGQGQASDKNQAQDAKPDGKPENKNNADNTNGMGEQGTDAKPNDDKKQNPSDAKKQQGSDGQGNDAKPNDDKKQNPNDAKNQQGNDGQGNDAKPNEGNQQNPNDAKNQQGKNAGQGNKPDEKTKQQAENLLNAINKADEKKQNGAKENSGQQQPMNNDKNGEPQKGNQTAKPEQSPNSNQPKKSDAGERKDSSAANKGDKNPEQSPMKNDAGAKPDAKNGTQEKKTDAGQAADKKENAGQKPEKNESGKADTPQKNDTPDKKDNAQGGSGNENKTPEKGQENKADNAAADKPMPMPNADKKDGAGSPEPKTGMKDDKTPMDHGAQQPQPGAGKPDVKPNETKDGQKNPSPVDADTQKKIDDLVKDQKGNDPKKSEEADKKLKEMEKQFNEKQKHDAFKKAKEEANKKCDNPAPGSNEPKPGDGKNGDGMGDGPGKNNAKKDSQGGQKPGDKAPEQPGDKGSEKPGDKGPDKPGDKGQQKPGEKGSEKPGDKGEQPGKSGDKGEQPGKPGDAKGQQPNQPGSQPGADAGNVKPTPPAQAEPVPTTPGNDRYHDKAGNLQIQKLDINKLKKEIDRDDVLKEAGWSKEEARKVLERLEAEQKRLDAQDTENAKPLAPQSGGALGNLGARQATAGDPSKNADAKTGAKAPPPRDYRDAYEELTRIISEKGKTPGKK